jgi:maltose O-acetyltransferase
MTSKIIRRLIAVYGELVILILHIAGWIPIHHVRRALYRAGGMRIGKGSTLHMCTTLYGTSGISIGEDTIIGEKATLDGRGGLIIGDHVDFASEVMVYTSQHDIHSSDFRAITKRVIIEDYVFIGPRAIILPGVSLGKGAVVGAGAVVTKDVAPGVVVGGIPAKQIGTRDLKTYAYRLKRAAWFR